MPKFKVYVERLVPQWRTVVVECDNESDIEHSLDVQREIFDAACNLDHWEYDDDCRDSQKPSKVTVVERTEEEPDLRVNNPEVR
jgi:hypothetical protein